MYIYIYTIYWKTDMFLPKDMCDIQYTILGCCLIIQHPKNHYGNLEEASEFLNTPKYQIVSYIPHSVPIKCVGFPCFPIIFSCTYQLLSPSVPGTWLGASTQRDEACTENCAVLTCASYGWAMFDYSDSSTINQSYVGNFPSTMEHMLPWYNVFLEK